MKTYNCIFDQKAEINGQVHSSFLAALQVVELQLMSTTKIMNTTIIREYKRYTTQTGERVNTRKERKKQAKKEKVANQEKRKKQVWKWRKRQSRKGERKEKRKTEKEASKRRRGNPKRKWKKSNEKVYRFALSCSNEDRFVRVCSVGWRFDLIVFFTFFSVQNRKVPFVIYIIFSYIFCAEKQKQKHAEIRRCVKKCHAVSRLKSDFQLDCWHQFCNWKVISWKGVQPVTTLFLAGVWPFDRDYCFWRALLSLSCSITCIESVQMPDYLVICARSTVHIYTLLVPWLGLLWCVYLLDG